MLASALSPLPSARLLAASLVASASALHFAGRLPGRWWMLLMLVALVLLAAGGAVTAERRTRLATGRWWLAAVRLGVALLLAGLLLLWRVHGALDARLPAALEGLELEVVGVVDGMAQRFDFGDRVRFSLGSCRIAGAGREGSSCGRLERLQLDWGALPEKHRSAWQPAPAGGDDDEVWPQPGQFWRLVVRLRRPVAPVNPGGFDLELRYLQQGVGALGRVYARQRLDGPPQGWGRGPGAAVLVAFEGWRTVLRDRLEAVYADRVDPAGAARPARWPMLGVVAGLALGDQGAIDAGLWGLFSRTGVSHLMAISGMHVTMLALVAAWLAGRLLKAMARRPGLAARLLARQPRQVLVLVVAISTAFGYALLSGWGIPSQRTCWMLGAAALASLSGRGRGAMEITLLAAAIVVAIDPWAVSTAGFWLSFGAVAAIVWCAHGQDSQGVLRVAIPGIASARLPSALREALTTQWAATVGLAPLVVALFSTFSLIGPLANAVAIPWVSFLVTPLAVAAALLAPFAEPLCAVLLQANVWMIGHLIAMLELFDRLPAASVAIAVPPTWTLVCALIGSAVLIAPPGFPMRPAGVLCLVPMLFAGPRLPSSGELWITVLDIGQGSSILVEAGRSRLLFDTGSGSGVDRSAASRFLLPYLRSRGIESIDTLVVSHLDVEHAGGAAAVLQGLRPARLVTGFDARLLNAPPEALAGVRLQSCTVGAKFTLADATVHVLHPPAAARLRDGARDNAGSCVMRIASPAGSVLLPADLPASAEAQLRGVLRSDVLIVPQQGGRNASSAALLAAVRPAHAVVQAGYRNRHRHPHPTVLDRLSDSGAQVLRTDLDGAIQIRLRTSADPQVYRWRRDAPPYWRIGGG